VPKQSPIGKRAGDVDVSRLCQDMYRSRLSLKPFRETVVRMSQLVVGTHWSQLGADKPQPLPLLSMYQATMTRRLVAANPRVSVTTWSPQMRAQASALEGWMNPEIENMDLAGTLRSVTAAALYCVGVTKVGLAMPANAAKANWDVRVGEPFASDVLLDNLVFDMHASSHREFGYIGDRYRVPIDVIKDSKLYDKSRLKLEPMEDPQFNNQGDLRVGVIGRDFYSSKEEWEDFVDLWDIYIPRHRMVITIPDTSIWDGEGSGEEPLRIADWVGPDEGPYHMLRLGNEIPGNVLTAAPMQSLVDLHESANNALRKLRRQVERQKDILIVGGSATDDAQNLTNLSDGDAGAINNIQSLEQKSYGGPNPQVYAAFGEFKNLFSWAAGNLESLAGLSPQAKTLGQDQMLSQASSSMVAAMQDQVLAHAGEVVKSLAWYWWNHPRMEMRSKFEPNGNPQYAIPRSLKPASAPSGIRRTGRLSDLDFKVQPFSLQGSTPQQRAATISGLMQTIVMPILPLLQQQGASIDLSEFLRVMAKYLDLPELPTIVKTTEPVQDQKGQSDQPTMPAQTNRTYTRVSQGNQTEDNKAQTGRMMMSGQMSPGERNGTVNR
jgi:hypothetical protein